MNKRLNRLVGVENLPVLKRYAQQGHVVLRTFLTITFLETVLQLAKRTDFGRQRTWLSLTSKGVDAYTAHVKELKRIVG